MDDLVRMPGTADHVLTQTEQAQTQRQGDSHGETTRSHGQATTSESHVATRTSSGGQHSAQVNLPSRENSEYLEHIPPPWLHNLSQSHYEQSQHSRHHCRLQQIEPHLRLVSDAEKQHLQCLLSTLNSCDNLALEALSRSESIPQTRLQLRREISDFMKNITTHLPDDGSIFDKVLYCPAAIGDLRLLCRNGSTTTAASSDSKGKEKEDAPITFDEFAEQAVESGENHHKSEVILTDRASTPRVHPGLASSMTDHDDIGRIKSKGKGKGKARDKRGSWEQDTDIPDDLL